MTWDSKSKYIFSLQTHLSILYSQTSLKIIIVHTIVKCFPLISLELKTSFTFLTCSSHFHLHIFILGLYKSSFAWFTVRDKPDVFDTMMKHGVQCILKNTDSDLEINNLFSWLTQNALGILNMLYIFLLHILFFSYICHYSMVHGCFL